MSQLWGRILPRVYVCHWANRSWQGDLFYVGRPKICFWQMSILWCRITTEELRKRRAGFSPPIPIHQSRIYLHWPRSQNRWFCHITLLLQTGDMLTRANLRRIWPGRALRDYNGCNRYASANPFRCVSDVPKTVSAKCRPHLYLHGRMVLVSVGLLADTPGWKSPLWMTIASKSPHLLLAASTGNANGQARDKGRLSQRDVLIVFW